MSASFGPLLGPQEIEKNQETMTASKKVVEREPHARTPRALRIPMTGFGTLAFFWCLMVAGGCFRAAAQTPLTTLDYTIVGTYLRVTPAAVAVPKGIAGSVLVELANSDGSDQTPDNAITQGAYIEAILRGPSFPARRVIGEVNKPLMLPALNLVGDYQLDNIRLVDATTGAVRMEGTPISVPVRVFEEVLVSRVTSRPLTLAEIQERGIVIDDQNFRAVEFEVGFVLDGRTIPVKFPVVSPDFSQAREIIPQSEIQRRLVEAQRINQELAAGGSLQLPDDLRTAGLNIQVKGANFEIVDVAERDLRLGIPPIPALMVIPGNIGYLNQFFSVQIFTENASPIGSGLSVFNLDAKLILPPGADLVASTNYSAPGDDPLRFARVGANKIIQPVQPIRRAGPDGVPGTADDISRLYPKEAGQAEFLVEGLREGLHVMDLELNGELDGLAAGTLKIKGRAAGSVLVRNPKFSLTFSHPRTVRTEEPYDAFVTILNTSQVEANFVSVTLPKGSISGGELMTAEKVELGTIKPGETRTAKYSIRAKRTGRVAFSNLTTSEDSILGRFKLRLGVDDRGVELSPDTIAYPEYVNRLPTEVFDAANRIIGQALGVATAPVLPPGVKPMSFSVIEKHVLEMAEAGQRLAYGESTNRVLLDLLLDFQGGRVANEGFDQIVRSGEAGREWREALALVMERNDVFTAHERLVARAADICGRGEAWQFATSGDTNLEMILTSTDGLVTLDASTLNRAAAYRGARGNFAALRSTNTTVRWAAKQSVDSAEIGALLLSSNGTGRLVRWTLISVSGGACYAFTIDPTNIVLRVDTDCDGEIDSQLAGTETPVVENSPQVLNVRAVPEVTSVRPWPSCIGAPANNYATTLAVLFSKPMTQTNANVPSAYRTDNGIAAGFVQMQPGGRVALLNLKQGVGAVHPRALLVDGVRDARGNVMPLSTNAILNLIREGAAIIGRVFRGDGSAAAFVPVTLTMNDVYKDPFDRCEPQIISKLAQVLTDENGSFEFDFVMAGVPYTISATDTGGLPPDVIREIIESWRGNKFDAERFAARLVQTNILAQMGVATSGEAVALAEGLDRAVWNDRIAYEAGAMGTERSVALRFRGRGTVLGKVVASDGVTPVARAAVNLFPDPDSRELGRGIFSDSLGRFQFNGVPLGPFSLQVKTGAGQFRNLAGLLETPGQIEEITVVLTAPTPEEILRTSLAGLITEPDNVTPHSGATVFIRNAQGRVVGSTQTDSSGVFQFNDIPVGGYYIGAFSVDNRRKAERSGVQAIAGVTAFVQLPLNGAGRVIGRVVNSTGQIVTNALVAGGEALVRTDYNGWFTLTGVPLGRRTINAGLEGKFAPQGFPRLGSASVDVLPGVDNFVQIQLNAAGIIIGTVRDASGNAVPFVNVAIPLPKGFAYTKANESGVFRFINLPPGQYTVSAPAPPVSKTDEELMEELRSEDNEQIMAALTEAFTLYSGVNTPSLGGTNATFNPGSWGYTTTSILADGGIGQANITYLKQGTVSGIVLNHQGVPIGAKVRLTGIGPAENGEPVMTLLGDQNSDPAEGTFLYPGRLKVGDWGVQVASPFYAVVMSQSGRTTDGDLNVTNLVFKFPPRQDTHGRLAGRVFNPDGTPVGAGVNVHTLFGQDGIHNTTDANGFFDNAFQINQGSYAVDASDSDTGFKARVVATVVAGRSNYVEITLKGLGNLEFQVFQGNGQPARNAEVKIDKGEWPPETRTGFTDTNGFYTANDLPVGRYGIAVKFATSTAVFQGRTGVDVLLNQTATTNLVLGATANITGTFRRRDTGEPISAARVGIGNLAFTPTGTNGTFSVNGVPLGTYKVIAVDSVTGRRGVGAVTLTFQDQTVHLDLVEQPQGEIRGVLYENGGTQTVNAAKVTLDPRDGISSKRFVTTGPDGAFLFPGVTPGEFVLEAENTTDPRRVVQNGTFPNESTTLFVNLTLPAKEVRGVVTVQVLRPGGSLGSNVVVTLSGIGSVNTDSNGVAVIGNVPTGGFTVRASSLVVNETFSQGQTNGVLVNSQLQTNALVRLSGVGAVKGRVFKSDGISGAAFATLRLQFLSDPFRNTVRGPFAADANGDFSINNVALGSYRLTAEDVALAATTNGIIAQAGQTNTVNLRLGASGAVIGRLVRADGATSVTNSDVLITFGSQSSLAGNAVTKTATNGSFGFTNVPIGNVRIDANVLQFFGVGLANGTLSSNGQVLDLGDVVLDEDFPQIVGLSPEHGTSGVSTLTTVDVVYNEPMLASTVNNNTNAIYLKAGTNTIASSVTLTNHADGKARVIRLTPRQPLKSMTTYELVVINGERRSATGVVIATGPADLVGRAQLLPLIAQFTTRDDDPPQLVSLFPLHNANEVDPLAVVRLSFNEPVRGTNVSLALLSNGAPVNGAVNLSADAKIMVFTPTAALTPNRAYSISLSNVFDLAGNRMVTEPLITSFRTVDTIGPVIGQVRIADGKQPVAGATVMFETLLATNEAGVSVRYADGFTVVGESTNGPSYRVPITLPTNGVLTLRATATDVFGNNGPFYETNITVVPNAAPTILLTRGSPTNGPIESGKAFRLWLAATDDLEVTNVTLVGIGSFPVVRTFTNGALTNILFDLPPTTVPGSNLQFRAQSTDALGIKSEEAVVDFIVKDSTTPNVTWIGPEQDSVVDPAQPLRVALAANDNSTNLTIRVTLSGAASGTQTWAVAVANVTLTNTFDFSIAEAPADGSQIHINLRYTDGETGDWSSSRSVRTIDRKSPRLVSITPTNGATHISPWRGGPSFTFSEPISSAGQFTNLFLMTNSAGMTTAVETASSFLDLKVTTGTMPLAFGETYFTTMFPGVRDGASNMVVMADGSAIPTEGVTTSFRTAGVLEVWPTNDTKLVAGQNFTMRTHVEEGFSAWLWHLRFDDVTAVSFATATTATNITRTLQAPTNAALVQFAVRASGNVGTEFGTLATVTLDVRSRAADDDGDGWLNGFESDRGMNAFAANPDSEDFDGDGLSNGQERTLGTDPADTDSDNDFLGDGAEVAIGSDPLNPDTDGDGLLDGQDNDPLNVLVGVRIVTASAVTVLEGEVTNLTVNVNCGGAPLLFVDSAPTNTPAFVWLDAITLNNTSTNGVGLTTLRINPFFADAGTYTVTLRAGATNATEAFSGTTNVVITVLPNPALQATRWKAGISGNWFTVTNWTDGLPGTNRIAVIDAAGVYTVTLNTGSPTIAGLVVGGGTGSPKLDIAGRVLTLNGGAVVRSNAVVGSTNNTINGAGLLALEGKLIVNQTTFNGTNTFVIQPQGLLDIVGNGEPNLVRPTHNFGTMEWRGTGRVFGNSGVTFHNRHGAWLNIRNDQSWPNGTLENSGTVTKESGVGTTTFNAFFRNNGLVKIKQGTMAFSSGGAHLGVFEVLQAATVNFGNPHDFAPSSLLLGAGNYLSTSTIDIRGTFALAGSNTVTSGTLKFSPGAKVQFSTNLVSVAGVLDLSAGVTQRVANMVVSGTVSGSDALEITNSLVMNGGQMTGTNWMTIATNATLTFASGEPTLSRNVNQYGTVIWSTPFRIFNDAVFHNYGALEVLRDSSWNNGAFNNYGVVTKHGGTNTTTFAGTAFYNSGLVQLQSGTLAISANCTNVAQITLAAGTLLQLSSGTHSVGPAGTIVGAGHFRLGSGSLTVTGQYDIGGSNHFASGTATFAPGSSVNFRSGNLRIGGTVHLNTGVPRMLDNLVVEGTLNGSDDVTATNVSLLTSGNIDGTGSLTIPVNGRLDFVSGEPVISRVCHNHGTARCLTTGRIFMNGGLFRNAGVLEIHSDNAWHNGVLINEGSVVRLTGTNTASFQGVTFTNRGLIQVQTGQLQFNSVSTVMESGTLFAGDATLRFSSGTLRLGTSVNFGALKVIFGFAPTFVGTFGMANNVNGVMTFNNTATLPGSLQIAGRLVVAANQTLTINGDLVATPTATIENLGQITVKGALQLNGAQVIGNTPQQPIPTPGFVLRIEGGSTATVGRGVGNDSGATDTVTLRWNGPAGATFEIESTSDFKKWTRREAPVTESVPGVYQVTLTTGGADQLFFRARKL